MTDKREASAQKIKHANVLLKVDAEGPEWSDEQAAEAFGIEQVFHWVTDLDYHGHRLQWLDCVETVGSLERAGHTNSRFVHLTNLAVTAKMVCVLSATGRLRWKIEDEGFNVQKNLGYALEHKYARISWQAAKNDYQRLQIGHLINH